MQREKAAMADNLKSKSYSRLERLMQNFYSLLQSVRIHQNNHTLVVKGIANFSRSIAGCMEGDSLAIKIVNGRLVVEDEMLPYNRITKNLIDNMARYFDVRGLQGLRLLEPIKQASAKDIFVFMHLLNGSRQRPDKQAWLTKGFNANNIFWVEIISKPEKESPENVEEFPTLDEKGRRERARKDYSHIMASFREVAQKVAGRGRVGMRKTVRVVQDMVRHLMDDDEVYSAISTLRVFDDYTFAHSVNVAILSMCVGKRINLSRRSLERLGTCALFHDLGKIKVPYEILNKQGKLDDSDVKLLEEHSLNSARLIIKLRASRERKAKILLPPFEHHLRCDLSGYPHASWKKPLTLFGRIIAIADVYDAITSPRVYRTSILSPDRALGYMLDGSGRIFDPILLKVFINMLGVYPVGTLLKLDTEELALVISASKKSGEKRPLVCLMHKDIIGNYYKGKIIDMAQRDSTTGYYTREIIETYHPSAFGIQPVQHIFPATE
jgi:HD-GYP domain-containing protein (c-di-GMP phosphodiesterase class II)